MQLNYEEATELYHILCDKMDDMREMGQDKEDPETYELVCDLCDRARGARYA